MSTEKIQRKNYPQYSHLIPSEFEEGIKEGFYLAVGGSFSDEPAGVLVYNDKDADTAVIRYLYVMPEYRRLGVATEMLDDIGFGYFSFSYEATGDRVTLEPFFEANDIDTECVEYPFSELSIRQIKQKLTEKGIYKTEFSGRFLNELDPAERKVVSDWLEMGFNDDVKGYDTGKPQSIFNVKDNTMDAALLMHELFSDTVMLDYLYSHKKNNTVVGGMLRRAFEKVVVDYGMDGYVRMLPAKEDGRKLYESLFGDVLYYLPVVYAV